MIVLQHNSFHQMKCNFQSAPFRPCQVVVNRGHISMVVDFGGEIGVYSRAEVFDSWSEKN
jgi:hypothetical protein